MAAQKVIALRLHNGEVSIKTAFGIEKIKMQLPKGCIGICFAFESKKAAIEYWGKNTEFVEIERFSGQ